MADYVRAGQPIKLRLQLTDEENTAFPQAEIVDQTGVQIASSPANLSHIGSGLYVNDSIPMPSDLILYAQYKVYSDAGYTQRHSFHCETLLDVFERDITGEKVENIETSIAANRGSLDFLSGLLEDGGELQGLIEDNTVSLIGLLEDQGQLVGIIEEPEILIGVLYAGDELIGQINC